MEIIVCLRSLLVAMMNVLWALSPLHVYYSRRRRWPVCEILRRDVIIVIDLPEFCIIVSGQSAVASVIRFGYFAYFSMRTAADTRHVASTLHILKLCVQHIFLSLTLNYQHKTLLHEFSQPFIMKNFKHI